MRRIAALFIVVVFSIVSVSGCATGKVRDSRNTLALWKPLADKGDAAAQFKLGVMYDYGEGVSQDHAEAAKWYQLAAEQGNAAAQNNIGVMYHKGEGVSQDDKEAMKWYRLAADQGNAAAKKNLGDMYYMQQDYDEAVKWYQSVVEQLRSQISDPDNRNLWLKATNKLSSAGKPQGFLDAKKRWEDSKKKLEQEKASAEARVKKAKQDEEAARWNEKLAELNREAAAELSVINETRANLRSKTFRQSFKTSVACRDFERQSNALMTRYEIGFSNPDEGRKFLSDVAVSFDECSSSAEFEKSGLREAYVTNFNGWKLMQAVWERGIKSCVAGDQLMRAYAGSNFNNCKWMGMPIQDYEGHSVVSELKTSAAGYNALIEREAERNKYKNYLGPISKAVSERLIKF